MESPLRVGRAPGKEGRKVRLPEPNGKVSGFKAPQILLPASPSVCPQPPNSSWPDGRKKKKEGEKKKKRGLAILHIPLPRPAPPSLNSHPRNNTMFLQTGYLKGRGGTAKLNWGQTGTNFSPRGEEASAQARAWCDRWRPAGPHTSPQGQGTRTGAAKREGWPAGPAPPPRGRLAAHGAPLLRGLEFPGWHRASCATCWGAETPILGPAGATGARGRWPGSRGRCSLLAGRQIAFFR